MKAWLSKSHVLYLMNKALCSPLECLFTLLIFILIKELDATTWQLTVLAASKPIVSLFSFQANSVIIGRPHRTRAFLAILWILGGLPCLFFPFVINAWYYIGSYALFITTLRASSPTWIELLKNEAGSHNIASSLLKGSSINYLTVMFLPLLLSFWMDANSDLWKSLFVCFGVLQLLALLILCFLKPSYNSSKKKEKGQRCTNPLLLWKEGWNLLKSNSAFARYHLLFFLGGAGLVALQPILPIYFKETLQLSYTQVTLAFSVCKGAAFVLSSPVWARWSNKISLYLINYWMNVLSLLFITLMLAASIATLGIFPAYLMYGAMQAGCELGWNLSGPYFAGGRESTYYSSMNLVFVGIRGCVCPFIGTFIFGLTNFVGVFIFAGFLCVISIIYALRLESIQSRAVPNQNY